MNALAWPLSVPVLTDGLVTLRAHQETDLPALVEMVTDPVTQEWTTVPREYHLKAAEQFLFETVVPGWNSGTNRIWVIDVGGEFAGQVDIRGTGPVKEIAYATHPNYRGHGIAQAGVRLALDCAFTQFGTDVVHWRAFVGNVASLKLAYACGFHFHDTIPKLLPDGDRALDAWTGSISFGEAPYPRGSWTESTVENQTVRLRPVGEQDWARWDEALAEAGAHQYLNIETGALGKTPARERFADVQWSAARGQNCAWVITEPGSDEFQGLIVANRLDDKFGGDTELEWLLHPDARGRGLMTAAVKLAVGYVLSPEGFDQRRLTAYVASSNGPSNATARRAGGHLFGTQTASEPLGDGSFDDLNEYEWRR